MNIKTVSLVAAIGCASEGAGRLIWLIIFINDGYHLSSLGWISFVCNIVLSVCLAVFFFVLWSKQKKVEEPSMSENNINEVLGIDEQNAAPNPSETTLPTEIDRGDPGHNVRQSVRGTHIRLLVLGAVVTIIGFTILLLLVSNRAKTKTIPLAKGVSLEMVHLPNIPNSLYFGKYEVTQAQWEAVMGDNPSMFEGADNPVENVSWYECQEFLENLNALPAVKKSGLLFRLPSEWEWEYACRAGATGGYCKLADGTEITKDTLGRVAWYEDNSDDKTHPVGQKEPNAFGLYDMFGHVWEWCRDVQYDEVAAFEKEKYVQLGGCWRGDAWTCKSSYRSIHSPDDRSEVFGFRLCAQKR